MPHSRLIPSGQRDGKPPCARVRDRRAPHLDGNGKREKCPAPPGKRNGNGAETGTVPGTVPAETVPGTVRNARARHCPKRPGTVRNARRHCPKRPGTVRNARGTVRKRERCPETGAVVPRKRERWCPALSETPGQGLSETHCPKRPGLALSETPGRRGNGARHCPKRGQCVCAGSVADCNGRTEDGCESDPLVDELNCGRCGRGCPSGVSCEAGECACEESEVGAGWSPAVSADGSAFAFASSEGVRLGSPSGGWVRADVGSDGATADAVAEMVAISGDGSTVAFSSRATNLDFLSRPAFRELASNTLFPSIAVGADGNPIVAWLDGNSLEINAARCAEPTCESPVEAHVLGSAGIVGGYISLGIDPAGRPVVVWYDDDEGDLVYALCGTPSCSASNQVHRVDTVGLVGAHASLAFAPNGFAVIAYFAIEQRDLKVAVCLDEACSTSVRRTLDTTGFTGTETSIAVRADGRPVISYREELKSVLKLVSCGDSTCSANNNITDLGLGGATTSLALLADGAPVVAHQSVDGVEVVACADPECLAAPTNHLIAPSASSPSLALDSEGRPVVAVTRSDGVGIVRCQDDRCDSFAGTATVALAGSYEVDLSIVDGRVFMAFRDDVEGRLRAGFCFLEACGRDDGFEDIFMAKGGSVARVSLGHDGSPANGPSMNPSLSGDGGTLAFVSAASNLVRGDENDVSEVFVFNAGSGAVERVTGGGVEPDGDSLEPSVSSDGRFVAFSTSATNLGGPPGLFVYDRVLRELRPVAGGASKRAPRLRGRKLVSVGDGVWVHELEGGTSRRAAEGTSADLDEEGRFLVHASAGHIGVIDLAASISATVAAGELPVMAGNGSVVAYEREGLLFARSPCLLR